ncbi:hypothetical protein [Streptosporangium sp. V21-05]|uniref:hypothetical protein n=1 Tax=Streptosporangium sp. V21-05 TaxID=3446115 RepID=UPI003F53152E
MNSTPPRLRVLPTVAADPVVIPVSKAAGERQLTSAEAVVARDEARRTGEDDTTATFADGTTIIWVDTPASPCVVVEHRDGAVTGHLYRTVDDAEHAWRLRVAHQVLPSTWDASLFWFLWRDVAHFGHQEFLAVVEHPLRLGRPRWWLIWHCGPDEMPVEAFDTEAEALKAIQDIAPTRQELQNSAPEQVRRNRALRRAALLLEAQFLEEGTL